MARFSTAPSETSTASETSQHSPASDRSLVLMFARVPERGAVKTRLAARVGDERALAVYRGLGKLIYSRVRPYHAHQADVRVVHTPDGGGDAVRNWLGETVTTMAGRWRPR